MTIEISTINRSIEKKNNSWVLIALLSVILIIVIIGVYFVLNKPKEKAIGTTYPEIQHDTKKTQEETQFIKFDSDYEFDDGLYNPVSKKEFKLDDMGQGVSEIVIFKLDINNDGQIDKIVKTKNENGTAHFYYSYKIELNTNSGFVDITPDGFRTIEGAECALQKLKFIFSPNFQVVKISRDWEESWDTPTVAKKMIYQLQKNVLEKIETKQLRKICDVSELF